LGFLILNALWQFSDVSGNWQRVFLAVVNGYKRLKLGRLRVDMWLIRDWSGEYAVVAVTKRKSKMTQVLTSILIVLSHFCSGQTSIPEVRTANSAVAAQPAQDSLSPRLIWVEGGSMKLGCGTSIKISRGKILCPSSSASLLAQIL
jgi:hypothetical protein